MERITAQHDYIGFLSYAHADEAIAARLHKALETYAVPKNLITDNSKNLSPIFRDITELTAHHDLSEKIRDAVNNSKYLIVLCSPAAKRSHWVNEEVRLFRKLHGEASILCVLSEGTPETSFPPALTEGGREPLAANLSGGKESFKLGVTQLAASMLGVGLDALIQRDSQRRRRRMNLIISLAAVFSAVMGVTAFTAIEARNDAQLSRGQAEGLVEYMITDLKEKLEPVGRLDILDSVGDRAVAYYDAQDITKASDESLSRQARARHILGQVAIEATREDDAVREINAAARLTQEVLNRNPDNVDAIFAHAQSEYWVGKIYLLQTNKNGVFKHWSNYNILALRLYSQNPTNIDYIMEAGYSENNLGFFAMSQEDYTQAVFRYNNAKSYYQRALEKNPDSAKFLNSLANALSGLAKALANLKNIDAALEFRKQQIGIYDKLLAESPDNYALIFRRANAQARIIEANLIPQLSQEYDKTISNIHRDMKRLTDHDPANKYWRDEYKYFKDALAQTSPPNP